MKSKRARFVWMIVALCVMSLEAQTAVPVTVRGTLSRGGKAGNLWTLALDRPLRIHDPGAASPEATTLIRRLSFIGGREGPQKPSYEGKHVEITGTLVAPFGHETAAVRVGTIRVLK